MPEKTITHRQTVFATNWFELVAKNVDGEALPYYSLEMQDYVSVLAITQDQQILLVRQYRPVLERYTLELPSGHVEKGESPEEAARRELIEETGHDSEHFESLGSLAPDTGRLGNRLWCFMASQSRPIATPVEREAGVEMLTCPQKELSRRIAEGEFNHALHLAVVMLAVARGKFTL